MLPVLISIGPVVIPSFGFFLTLSFFLAVFTIWRLTQTWDLDKELSLDLIILTTLGGFITARLFFMANNLNFFLANPLSSLMIFRVPGFSFWGGFFGGLVTFYLVTRFPRFISKASAGLLLSGGKENFKLNFWQLGDIAIVGLIMGIAITSFGCLLGSCQYGLPSNLPFAVGQVGLIGKRFPLQIIEMITFLIIFKMLWNKALKFHTPGQILGIGLIYLGVFKFILEFFRGDRATQPWLLNFSLGNVYSLLLIIGGTVIFYRLTKKSFRQDLLFVLRLPITKNSQKVVVSKLVKSCYNLVIKLKLTVSGWRKNLLKLINVKPNPPKLKSY